MLRPENLWEETLKFRYFAVAMLLTACEGDKGTETDGELTRAETIAALTADTVNGDSVYAETCAVCHGADGTGISGPDLTASGFNEAQYIDIVIDGEGNMPGFGDDLSDQDIKDVVAAAMAL